MGVSSAGMSLWVRGVLAAIPSSGGGAVVDRPVVVGGGGGGVEGGGLGGGRGGCAIKGGWLGCTDCCCWICSCLDDASILRRPSFF